jgi:glycerol-1-phosphate dehydrogenase [NAD(P)+]
MLPSPLYVDIRSGAVDDLATLLHDRHISPRGEVLVVVGSQQGKAICARIMPALPNATSFTVQDATVATAGEIEALLKARPYDALVAIGGGRTIDVGKYAATRAGVPMVAVATNLAHDGLCSPVASLPHDSGVGSFGVAMPLAAVVDLDYVRAAPDVMVRAGIGDVLSNLSAVEDWLLACRELGEPVDGLALAMARVAAESLLHREDSVEQPHFLVGLAEALVLSGMSMSVAGTSRPCSGACHEIVHAIDHLFQGTAPHGHLAGMGALFACFLREDFELMKQLSSCLKQHRLPRLPADVGLSDEEFAEAVLYAPHTRPGRYTILEHLSLDASATRAAVHDFTACVD